MSELLWLIGIVWIVAIISTGLGWSPPSDPREDEFYRQRDAKERSG